MKHSLNTLYQTVGITKQGLHKRLNWDLQQSSYKHQLLFLIYEVRKDHPTIGCRDMYHYIQPDFIGRDKFEEFCSVHKLSSKKPKNYRKTTDSLGVTRFENLTIELVLTRINQLWVSDITYYDIGGVFHYITFIMDAFSRRIIGHNVSSRLFTEQTSLPALEMAVKRRRGTSIKETIFHSDGGGQYYDKAFLERTQKLNLINSMCEYPWENAKAERINGVIKNNYLKHWNITTSNQLQQSVDRAVLLYNKEKPHIGLKRLSPIVFENLYIGNGKTSDDEKSTTENENHNSRAKNSPSGCGKTSSDSNITQEYEKNNNLIVT